MAKKVLQLFKEDESIRIAITTPLKGYQLCYWMNRMLGCYFVKLNAYEYRKNENGEEVRIEILPSYYKESKIDTFYEVFQWHDKEHHQKWTCIANKIVRHTNGEDSLFSFKMESFYWDKSQKKADFILEMDEEPEHCDMETLLNGLRKIPNVAFVQEI